jgi:hypothetical protein
MALHGNARRLPIWAPLDWTFAYGYVVLCAGCYASYRGAPAISILVIATLLALPNVVKNRTPQGSTAEFCAHIVIAILFAVVAHTVGWGIERAIGG